MKLRQTFKLLKNLPIKAHILLLRSYTRMFMQADSLGKNSAEKPEGVRLIRYVDALREAFEQEMERDPSVFLFGLDVDDHKGIQGSTIGLQEKFGKDRVFCTPLSEDAMTGVAIGAAMAGYRPI